MTMQTRGFTLVELLVVIAIIGILAGIVLASLSGARGGSSDAKIKAQLANMRSQSELYIGGGAQFNAGGGGIPTTCALTAGTIFDTASNGLGTLFGGIGLGNTRCYAAAGLPKNGSVWAVAVLINSNANAWCVDSRGTSRGANSAGTTYTTLDSAITPTTGTACN
ncbi:prepilin-type N-terminal cleavage/methylation domain-containing protein [Acetobacteraceae bacterium]|nr:prepilin-type N-terminal cleavage/methylation domain-containing protein [Candidatus Parcubacteria bacterium]